jgi:lipopolysaccharide biosynthesis glycosyltransferase
MSIIRVMPRSSGGGSAELDDVDSHDRFPVVSSSDREQFAGLFASVASLLSAVSDVRRVHVYIIASADDVAIAERGVRDCLKHPDSVSVLTFDPSVVKAKSVVAADRVKSSGNLNADQNFLRFYLSEVLPQEAGQTVLYLDADTIVHGDVLTLASTLDELPDDIVAGIVPRKDPAYGKFITHGILKERGIPVDAPTFNAGVLLLRLDRWRAQGVTGAAESVMRRQQKEQLYQLGSQPPLLLALYGHTTALDTKWNVVGLGYLTDLRGLDDAFLLHWNGPGKPWLPDGLWKKYYEPFACPAFS